MATKHTNLLKRAALRAEAIRGAFVRIYRNESGHGVVGNIKAIHEAETIKLYPGDFVVRGGRRTSFGIATGGGDLIGLASIVVTQEMVGQRVALFVSGEGKVDGDRMSDEQREWHQTVLDAGGVSVEIRDPEDAARAICAKLGIA